MPVLGTFFMYSKVVVESKNDIFSFTKLKNRRVKKVLPGGIGISGGGEVRKGCRG
jgi:hypothetical protein